MLLQFLETISGPTGALGLMASILWWLANRILPEITRYFDGHNEKLGKLIDALEKTVDAHEKDREIFTQTISGITTRLGAVEDKVEIIHKVIVSQNTTENR